MSNEEYCINGCGRAVDNQGDHCPVYPNCHPLPKAESVPPAPQEDDRLIIPQDYGKNIQLKRPPVAAEVKRDLPEITQSLPKRFTPGISSSEEHVSDFGNSIEYEAILCESLDGDYVLHSDYVSLREELDKWKKIVDWVLQKCDAYPQLAYPVGKSLERPLIQQIQCAMHQVFSVAQAKATYERIAKEQQARAIKAESELADMRKALQNITALELEPFGFVLAKRISTEALGKVKP